MKHLYILAIFCLSSICVHSQAAGVSKKIAEYFNANDHQSISALFADHLDLSIESQSASYSKEQASKVLRDFFGSHKITSYKVLHKGFSNEKLHYSIANMKSKDINWSVYILINTDNKITQLQIEIE
jgi:hypothetical protein